MGDLGKALSGDLGEAEGFSTVFLVDRVYPMLAPFANRGCSRSGGRDIPSNNASEGPDELLELVVVHLRGS